MGVGGLVLEQGNRGGDGVLDQGAHVFEDGHGLLAIDDVLDGGFLSILSGDEVAGDVFVSAEGVGDGAGGAVIGGKDEDVALVFCLGGGQVGLLPGSWPC